ncbi:recombinase family protein [Burkholderia ubonensis]|uniref:recombinase family protein n=1 Tax=Burkholderia ubonensis TaxID=101571 RepID=UPI002ABDD339|nr:recombinase family protein [Burkholderia ubonensis]
MREPDCIIRLKTVLARTGLSRSTIYRKIAEGTFPAQIRISVNGAGWRVSEISRWIANPVGWRPRHSFSRFFRDHFELEFYVRKLAKHGVKLVSITQEMGDDPMHVMMRQIMALFDEYQSKENAKHVLRALKENARQGFWNGSLPPIGYRVVAAEQRRAKTKKKLEIDPLHADTVRLIYRLALEGDGTSGPMGVKNITSYLNARRIFTRDGGRWGIGQVHRILTRETHIGEHEFNKRSKTKALKPATEVVAVPVPPLIDRPTFDAVQAHLRSRSPEVIPARVVSGPTLLTGICHCGKCGGAVTLRTGKGGAYRYYTCSIKARQGSPARASRCPTISSPAIWRSGCSSPSGWRKSLLASLTVARKRPGRDSLKIRRISA